MKASELPDLVRADELKLKKQRMDELVILIDMVPPESLTSAQRSKIEDLKSRLQFRLGELVAECKIREMDIKIGVMQEVLEVHKGKK